MATIQRKKSTNGTVRYTVRYYIGKEYKYISFGSRFSKSIEAYARCIQEVVDYVEAYGPDYPLRKSTSAFIDEHTELKEKLQKAGLIPAPKQSTLVGLWDMLEEHAKKMGHKDSTIKQYKSARKWFFRYFDEEQRVETVTKNDAKEFYAWLERQNNKYGKPISPQSVAGYMKTIKTVFNVAVDEELIDRSPFRSIQKKGFVNPARQFEVSLEMFSDILDACPDQGWRVLFVLWRFGGLRKMEPPLLMWEDVFWDKGKIRVHSPKTERYEGHAERYCPLFPEIRQELEDLWELAEPGAVYLLPDDIRKRSENGIYNAVKRIVRWAGYTPWQRLINNMRATRDSELKRAGFSGDQRSAWLGHSEKVSAEHYQIGNMLVGDEDYKRACDMRTLSAKQPVILLTAETATKMATSITKS